MAGYSSETKKAVVRLYNDGNHSMTALSKIFGPTRQTISDWVEEHTEGGRNRSIGRPSMFTEDHVKSVKSWIQKDPWITNEKIKIRLENANLVASNGSIQGWLARTELAALRQKLRREAQNKPKTSKRAPLRLTRPEIRSHVELMIRKNPSITNSQIKEKLDGTHYEVDMYDLVEWLNTSRLGLLRNDLQARSGRKEVKVVEVPIEQEKAEVEVEVPKVEKGWLEQIQALGISGIWLDGNQITLKATGSIEHLESVAQKLLRRAFQDKVGLQMNMETSGEEASLTIYLDS